MAAPFRSARILLVDSIRASCQRGAESSHKELPTQSLRKESNGCTAGRTAWAGARTEGGFVREHQPGSRSGRNAYWAVAPRGALTGAVAPRGAHTGAVAQMGERLICIQEVTGSIPVSSTRTWSEGAGSAGRGWRGGEAKDNQRACSSVG